MLKKTLTYKTLDGEEVTEDFFFSLSKADILELEVSHPGGLGEHLKRISASQDGKEIIAAFKDILRKSYGRKSPDGKRFMKSDQIWEEFESSEAYSDLFLELVTNADAAAEFVNGIIPAGLEAQLEKIQAQAAVAVGPGGGGGAGQLVARKLTQAEQREMDPAELKAGLISGRYAL